METTRQKMDRLSSMVKYYDTEYHAQGLYAAYVAKLADEHLLDKASKCPGSRNHHHNWPGGYWDHISEVSQNVSYLCMQHKLSSFATNELILAAILHDYDKLLNYMVDYTLPSIDPAVVVAREFGRWLSVDQTHAICYHHGGWSLACSSVHGSQPELRTSAIILHCADLMSSHIQGVKKDANR